MARKKPNISIPSYKRSRQNFQNLVLEVIEDSFIFEFVPDSIELLEGNLFKLVLENKKFIEDTLKVDIPSDYVKIYLFSIEIPKTKYSISISNNNLIITFNEELTRLPQDVIRQNFKVKGRITST
jgi:hypothetical protein